MVSAQIVSFISSVQTRNSGLIISLLSAESLRLQCQADVHDDVSLVWSDITMSGIRYTRIWSVDHWN